MVIRILFKTQVTKIEKHEDQIINNSYFSDAHDEQLYQK